MEASVQGQADPHTKWWTLLAVGVGVFMLLLDITIVNVALPDIQSSLHASFDQLQWVVDAYALLLAATLLASGSLADRTGRRRVFSVGLAIFSLSSLVCGLSVDATMLDLARGVQGIGGAMMFATSLALIGQEFHGAERATAFGIIGAVTGGAVAVGPLIGGGITQALGWEWIFLVNVPIGIAAIALTQLRLREWRDPTASRPDWLGTVLFSGALFLLVFALIRGNAQGWASGTSIGMFVGCGVLLLAFLAYERRAEHPLLDLSLFRKPAFTGISVVAFVLSASAFSMFLYLTLYLQNILGYSPLEAGVRFLPSTLLSFLAAPIAGKLTAKVPARAFFGVGLLLTGIGLVLMSGIDPGDGWTTLLAGFVVQGAGIGMINPPLADSAIGVVPVERAGMGSGINSTFRQVGIATGIAALGAIFQARVHSEVVSGLAGTPGAAHADQLSSAIASGGAQQAIRSVPPQARDAVAHVAREAFVSGLNEILVIAAAVAFFGAVCGALLVRRKDFVQHGGPPGAGPPPEPEQEAVAV